MLDHKLAYEALESRIVFENPVNPDIPKLASDLLPTTAYKLNVCNVDNAKPWIDIENVYKTLYHFTANHTDLVEDYAAGTTYVIGDRVKFTIGDYTYIFVSRVDANTGNTPAFVSNYWESDLSDYLRKVRQRSAIALVNEVVTEKNIAQKVKSLMDITPVFGFNDNRGTLTLSDKFRGVKICVANANHLQFQIKTVNLFASTTQSGVTFYLYHPSQSAPILTKDVDLTGGEYKKYDIDFSFKSVESTHGTGDYFIFGFYDDDVTGTVESFGIDHKRIQDKYFSSVEPIEFPSTALNKPNLPNIAGDEYPVRTVFNLDVIAQCDYTYHVQQCPEQYDLALQYKTAISILTEIKNDKRISGSNDKANLDIDRILDSTYFENGNEAKKGLLSIYGMYKKQIKINLSGIDPECLRINKIFY